jgi:nucleotide-binding universal stress UspA family protein
MNSGKKVLLAGINSLNPPEKYMHYAFNLARDLNMNLHFVQVFNPDLYPIGLPYTTGDQVQFTQENLNDLTDEITRNLKSAESRIKTGYVEETEVEYSSEVGISYDIIKKYTSDYKVDMVVIEGNTSATELNYLTEEGIDIIEKSDVPVWIVPVDADYKPLKKIVYATDYNEEDIDTLNSISKIARKFSSEITAVHVTNNSDFKERINAEGFEKIVHEKTGYPHIRFELLSPGDDSVEYTINKYVTTSGGDLIVMLKENQNFLKRLFTKGHVKSALKHVHLPMLVFHEKTI